MAITSAAPTGADSHDSAEGPPEQVHGSPQPDAPKEPVKAGQDSKSPLVLIMVLLLLVLLQGPIRGALSAPVMQSWMTVFVAVLVQALSPRRPYEESPTGSQGIRTGPRQAIGPVRRIGTEQWGRGMKRPDRWRRGMHQRSGYGQH